MAGIILQQAIIMLILNVVGMIAYYTGIVSREGGKQLSNVVLEIVTPVIIVHAYLEEEYDSRLVVNLLLTFVLAACGRYPYLFHLRRHFRWTRAHLAEYFRK